MKYLCLVHVDGAMMAALSPEEDAAQVRESIAYDQEMQRSGHYITSDALQEPETAVLLRVRNGKLAMTDGPYADTKEHLGGFLLIEARDLNEAVAVAGKIPMARFGTIEVRPVFELDP